MVEWFKQLWLELGFHVHTWGKWKPSWQHGEFKSMFQQKQCTTCGYVKERMI